MGKRYDFVFDCVYDECFCFICVYLFVIILLIIYNVCDLF